MGTGRSRERLPHHGLRCPLAPELRGRRIPFFDSLRGTDAGELGALWEKLSAAATIIQPLGPAALSPLYGMLKDQFGVTWVFDLEVPYRG